MASKDDEPEVMHDPREYQRSRAYQIHSYSDTGHDLTVEEQLFCRSYIIDRNTIGAMRRLGYSEELSADALKYRAERMLQKPEVQACIEVLAKKMMDNLQITAEKVNEVAAAIAFFDLGEVAEWDAGGISLIHSKFWTKNQRLAVASVKMTKDGIELKMNDRQKAIDFLGKQLNLVDSDKDAIRMAAEGAAAAAMDKILEVTEKMRAGAAPALPKPVDADEEHRTVQ